MLAPVNPASIPHRPFPQGAMPVIGMGTFGSDHCPPQSVSQAVRDAAELGYRHFDCAEVYANEAEIGQAFQAILASGVPREELWVTSKVWNDHHQPSDLVDACQRSLEKLRLDYLDLYLVHWPFPNYHPPGCSVETRNPNAQPYSHSGFMRTWEAMESLLQRGLVRNIGVSNMTIPKLELLLADAAIPPACNEMELHPHFQQPELFAFLLERNIVPIAYCPLGSPSRPERDRTPDDTADMEDPVIVSIAHARRLHPAAVCLKWAVQRGHIPIPMSTNAQHLAANLQAVVGEPLSEEEMSAIADVDRNCRLIKGQVFLWPGARDWRDLWDLDGTIPS